MIGQTLDQYTIIDKIGHGAMGVVYKAHDTKMNRVVALKLVPAKLLQCDDGRAQFINEAQSAAAIRHPNICRIYDVCDVDGVTFIAMAFYSWQDAA